MSINIAKLIKNQEKDKCNICVATATYLCEKDLSSHNIYKDTHKKGKK